MQKDNEDHCVLLESLAIPYNPELDVPCGQQLSTGIIRKITKGMLSIWEAPVYIWNGVTLQGSWCFWYGKADQRDSGDTKEANCATIQEFDIRPR